MNTPHPRSAAAVAADCYAEGYENGTVDAEHGDPITAYLVDCEDAEYVTGYLNGYHAGADSLAAFLATEVA